MGKILTIGVKITPTDFLERFTWASVVYYEGVSIVFRTSVFQFLAMLIRIHRVDSGRMKAGWTAIMNQYSYNYSKSWTPGPKENAEAIAEGMAAGSFEYYPSTDPWNITVINGVKYAGIVEALYGSTLWGPIPCLVPNFEGFVRDGMSILNELSKDRFWEAKSYENDIPQDPVTQL